MVTSLANLAQYHVSDTEFMRLNRTQRARHSLTRHLHATTQWFRGQMLYPHYNTIRYDRRV